MLRFIRRDVMPAIRNMSDKALGRINFGVKWKNNNSFILILGHMRSGSSLLMHILCSHPDVCGYGETHFCYRRRSDVYSSLWRISREFKHEYVSSKNYVDKVLHSYLIPTPSVIDHSFVRCIFLIRRPDHSLDSLMRLPACKTSNSLVNSVSHYTLQLKWMKLMVDSLGKSRVTALKYESLVSDTASVLKELSGYLDLGTPLSEEYTVTHYTGRKGVGDPGPLIYSGKVVKNTEKNVENEILFEANKLKERYDFVLKQWRRKGILISD